MFLHKLVVGAQVCPDVVLDAGVAVRLFDRKDEVTMEICQNVAASSAMRLVRDYEQVVRSALASPAISGGAAEEIVRAAELLKPFVEFAHSWRDIPGVVKTYPDVELWQKPGWVERSGMNVGHLRAAAEAQAILSSIGGEGVQTSACMEGAVTAEGANAKPGGDRS